MAHFEDHMRGDVISQCGATPLPVVGVGQRRLARPDRQDQQDDPVPTVASLASGRNVPEDIPAQQDQYPILL